LLSHIPFSLLELAPMAKGSTVSETLQKTTRYAQKAEQLGFNRFWLAEHHNMPGIVCAATSILIGQVAANTSRIRVGSGGVMLPNHSTLVVAEQFGTLENLYPGRIDLGLGRAPGSDQLTSQALNADIQRADNFPSEVSELQQLLGPYDGKRRVRAIPGEDTNVPIWLLGSSLFSAKLAAQKGLPYVFAGHFAPRFLQDALALYRREFKPSNTLATPYFMLALPVVAADTDEQAQYLSTTSKQRVLSLLRGQPLWLVPPVETMDGLWSEQEKAQVNDFLSLSIVGGPESIKHKLKTIAEQLGVNEFIFTNDLYDSEARHHALEILMDIKN